MKSTRALGKINCAAEVVEVSLRDLRVGWRWFKYNRKKVKSAEYQKKLRCGLPSLESVLIFLLLQIENTSIANITRSLTSAVRNPW